MHVLAAGIEQPEPAMLQLVDIRNSQDYSCGDTYVSSALIFKNDVNDTTLVFVCLFVCFLVPERELFTICLARVERS